MYQSSTIYAVSSGGLPAGIAVIRLSGSLAKSALYSLCGFVPADREMRLAEIRSSAGDILDKGLVVSFSGPASFTGEDCAELHVHGGRASVAAVLGVLGQIEGLRPAEAGEFTRRAFVNGKMDLTSVEALGDLIVAETDLQRRLALANADGAQAGLYNAWRERILQARAQIEADIDFSDEEGVPDDVASGLFASLSELVAEMAVHLANARVGEIVRDGFRIVILGAPNAGKSSLLNCFAKRDVAIVSDEPGTTRDLVEVVLDLDGVRVVMTDTAGIRSDPGYVESIGIGKAVATARSADLLLLLEDLSGPVPVSIPGGVPVLRVGSKCDLDDGNGVAGDWDHRISVEAGTGLDSLLAGIMTIVADSTGAALESVIPSRLRHVELVGACRDHIVAANTLFSAVELCGEELRLAGDDIGRLTGAIETEDVLGEIFSSFCIGK